MKTIISTELREQAGSNSYNRFEYQVHWIVYHMIQEYKKNSEFYIFCEFHDDMTKTSLLEKPNCAEFFQIKTTERFKQWSLKNLFKTYKKQGGGIKNSFLGFLFYNFLKFSEECTKCHFVSNIGMDETVRVWQSVIEDRKELKTEEPSLYNEIKGLLREEYKDLEIEEFNNVFEIFIQNTFLYHGELPLENYEKVVAGSFFVMLENDKIYTSNSNKILKDLIEEVRKKSKKKIQTPISYNALKKEKGISSEIFSKIKDYITDIEDDEQKYYELEETLEEQRIGNFRIKLLIRLLKIHKRKTLDFSNTLYINSAEEILEIIDETLLNYYESIDDFEYLKTTVLNKVIQKCECIISNKVGIDKVLVEALFYERLVT
ncbi:dsDNA nuclease domain-containing protein [Bacillus cereus group sp. MYBK77-1]|uniref:dsDNA nuclease domain-containing protein n=2 Tax=Bacillus TaxID=1386 RepID=UPI00016B9441|nr:MULTISPECIES: dsDNA nuclease domain-containing protein [unclassified Bacillus cereus group]EDZ59238.1 hypothetical protein BCH308197_2909 [Bacillus cereus H3081.97]KKZ96517.1 hypothetical protein B4086_2796 [Bacillus cereus]KXI72443.1 hypothetical protein ACS51_01155 [Bacillus cereus]MDX5914430.1 dsDNA nuclease domain-containing protein [Bacillus cereus group sp. BfR-BA-01026]